MGPRIVSKSAQRSSASSDSARRRLFLAFYPKTGSAPDSRTHTALLLVPSTPSIGQKDTIRYHICISRGLGWDYSRDEVPARTPQLAAAAFVAEVPAHIPEAEIARVAEAVPIRHCDPDWNCYHWACDALLALQQARFISGLPTGDPLQVWRQGLEFCRLRHADADAQGDGIPVCDAAGRPLTVML